MHWKLASVSVSVRVVEHRGVGPALHPATQVLGEAAREQIRQREEAALLGVDRIDRRHRLLDLAVVGVRRLVLPARLDQHLHERGEEVLMLGRGRQGEGIDGAGAGVEAQRQVAPVQARASTGGSCRQDRR